MIAIQRTSHSASTDAINTLVQWGVTADYRNAPPNITSRSYYRSLHDFHKTYHLPSSIVFSFPPGVACSPARSGCRVVFSSSHPRWHPSSISCLISSICLHTAGPLYLRYELAMSLAANDLPQHVATTLLRTTNKHRIGPQKCCQDNYIYKARRIFIDNSFIRCRYLPHCLARSIVSHWVTFKCVCRWSGAYCEFWSPISMRSADAHSFSMPHFTWSVFSGSTSVYSCEEFSE